MCGGDHEVGWSLYAVCPTPTPPCLCTLPLTWIETTDCPLETDEKILFRASPTPLEMPEIIEIAVASGLPMVADKLMDTVKSLLDL